MRKIVQYVPKWIAPRLVLGLLLTAVGLVCVLFVPPLFDQHTGNGDVAKNPSAGRAPAGACPTAVVKVAVRCEINAVRAANGLGALTVTKALGIAAQDHSEDMVRRHYFAHVSPSGQTLTDRVTRAGYLAGARSHHIGENIAWGTGTASSPAAIVKSWMASPPHRAIILTRDFRDGGIGIAQGAPQGGGGETYVLDVGNRK
jgi:uncharacterized protein YkwD